MKGFVDRIRNIIGIFFVIIGMWSIFTMKQNMLGILFVLQGISLLPVIYRKIPILSKRKKMPVVLPIAIFLITLVCVPAMDSNTNSTANNTEKNEIVQANVEETITPESLNFEESEITVDIKELKELSLNVNPTDAKLEGIEFENTNEEVLKIENDEQKQQEGTIVLKINPVKEGITEIYAKVNEIESNKVKVNVVDNERIEKERIEAEEQAKKEEEEKAKQEAERQAQEQLQKEAEEQAKKTAEQSQTKQAKSVTTQQTQNSKSTGSKKSGTSQSSANKTNSRTVYITPTGKRYHYSSTCGGKNSTATTIDNARARGLTPCKKCAQ